MKNRSNLLGGGAFFGVNFILVLGLTGPQKVSAQIPMGTAFTYQGRLLVSLAPPNTPHDLTFKIFTNATIGNAIAGPVTNLSVAVSNGLFTTKIDFGAGPFDGDKRFLEIAARPADSGSFTTITPRQELTPTPYAIYAASAGTAAAVSGTVTCARRKYYMTANFPTGAQVLTNCVAGYHFASLAEIWDPSNLDYAQNGVDVPNGTAHTLPDSGSGPPFSSLAFIRIGVTGTLNTVPGNANCIVGGVPWSSASSSVFGTVIALKPTWTDTAINVSPWDAEVRECDNPTSPAPHVHSWCVQDAN